METVTIVTPYGVIGWEIVNVEEWLSVSDAHNVVSMQPA